MGVASVEYDPKHSLLLIGGQADQSMESNGDTARAAQHGITAWRILSDVPHYKLFTDYDQDLSQVNHLLMCLHFKLSFTLQNPSS